MEWLLDFYLCNKDWIDLIKDIVFLLGALTIVKFFWNKRFKDQSQAIEHALTKRHSIEKHLNDYVYEKHKNKVGIGIRFVHWKNYPNKLDNDAFAQELFTWPRENKVLPSGFINNTGINFIEPLWRYSESVYIDHNGIFFFATKNTKISGFKEIQNCILVKHLPYTNIINFDFREFIEYEPVFYTKYSYNSWKLYDDVLIIRNRPDETWINIELSKKRMLQKYSWFNYKRLKLKLWFVHFFSPKKSDL